MFLSTSRASLSITPCTKHTQHQLHYAPNTHSISYTMHQTHSTAPATLCTKHTHSTSYTMHQTHTAPATLCTKHTHSTSYTMHQTHTAPATLCTKHTHSTSYTSTVATDTGGVTCVSLIRLAVCSFSLIRACSSSLILWSLNVNSSLPVSVSSWMEGEA